MRTYAITAVITVNADNDADAKVRRLGGQLWQEAGYNNREVYIAKVEVHASQRVG